jgi:hypothetical protein
LNVLNRNFLLIYMSTKGLRFQSLEVSLMACARSYQILKRYVTPSIGTPIMCSSFFQEKWLRLQPCRETELSSKENSITTHLRDSSRGISKSLLFVQFALAQTQKSLKINDSCFWFAKPVAQNRPYQRCRVLNFGSIR